MTKTNVIWNLDNKAPSNIASPRREEALERMEVAVESIYNAITSLADVAEDQSDRGLVAVLNAYAYRPLMAEYEKLAE